MKAEILSLEGKKVKSIDLPIQFSEEYRPDLIKRAILAIFSHKRQSYGVFERAGKQQSAKLSRRRHDYKGAYGIGISRAPRKTMWRRGTQFGWVGAYAPFSVGGRRAHPPMPNKVWDEKINKKERRKAIRSAISATAIKELFNYEVPFVLENKFEDLSKTKDVKVVLKNINLLNEIERCQKRKIRAGKGKLRGRTYKKKIGPLIVVSKDCNIIKAAENLPGVNVVKVNELNASSLTKGVNLARLTLYTEAAIERLKNENLFTNEVKHIKEQVKEKPVVKKEVVKKEIKKLLVKKEIKKVAKK
ncbi:50S ribosomal protein L4 [Candidatus Woesearchaeota archaeon]|nr:50S ribosomal protein L4 [Candidatus Woesearchaeota archaeon]